MEGCHKDDFELAKRCEELARSLADAFGYDLRVLEHKRRPTPGGHTGLCYQAERRICVVIRYRTGKQWWEMPLSLPYILRVVCHEIAHLPKHGSDIGLTDGPVHREVERVLVDWARAHGFDVLA